MIWAGGLAALFVTAQSLLAWRLSWHYRCASIADIFWPLHHLLCAVVLGLSLPISSSIGAGLTLGLISVWALRLATHIAVRQAGAGEDRRYRAVREQTGINFDRDSVWLIFIPQALMAWLISLLLVPALTAAAWHWSAYIGVLIGLVGLSWEVIADLQLTAFLKHRGSHEVMRSGLWALCRHPNYFGEWLFWLGQTLIALSLADNWGLLALVPMALVTFLLLRFTGVARTEDGITEHRPEYAAYQQHTPAFFPNPTALCRVARASLAKVTSLSVIIFGLSVSNSEQVFAAPVQSQNWYFDVQIDDQTVGFHEFTATRNDSGYEVVANAKFRYTIFGVPVFSYRHQVSERYDKDMCLQSIASETKINGRTQTLQGTANAEGFSLRTNSAQTLEQGCLLAFAYWSPALLTQQRLLNGQSGEVIDIAIGGPLPAVSESAKDGTGEAREEDRRRKGPKEDAKIDKESLQLYTLAGGEIDMTLGYSAAGDWRTLESRLPNGRTLSYRLRP
ncbi:MAG TPA: hypothetical protein DE147_02295 [Gammaproteobacteria bacterium]|nr:hypothetical protein [Gammaproteobacteria bacterium]